MGSANQGDGNRDVQVARHRVAWFCAIANALAMIAMGILLAPGTELGGAVATRMDYIGQHRFLWAFGWGLWSLAAISLVVFYRWWASYLRRGWQPAAAVALAAAGVVGDLTAQSLLITRLPVDLNSVAPIATMLTGVYANGMYTLAGIWLTLQTQAINGWLRTIAWPMWLAGVLVSVFTYLHLFAGVAIATVVLFAIFCPWVVLVGRRLA